jgi:hypothetical protein
MNSYHYGQAPNPTQSAPFAYNPTNRTGPVSYRSLTPQAAIQPRVVGVYGTADQTQPAPTYNYGMDSVVPNVPLHNPPIPSGVPGIRPASEIYPSGGWNPAVPERNYPPRPASQFSQQPYGTAARGKGGKGRGTWGNQGSQPVGKAANAIPLGKQRIFASSAEVEVPREEPRHERPRSPRPPMRVVGRGRDLTMPAWAKQQREAPPGERFPDDRSVRRQDDSSGRRQEARLERPYEERRDEPRFPRSFEDRRDEPRYPRSYEERRDEPRESRPYDRRRDEPHSTPRREESRSTHSTRYRDEPRSAREDSRRREPRRRSRTPPRRRESPYRRA